MVDQRFQRIKNAKNIESVCSKNSNSPKRNISLFGNRKSDAKMFECKSVEKLDCTLSEIIRFPKELHPI